MKHTPGPWMIVYEGDGTKKPVVTDINGVSLLTVKDEDSSTFAAIYDEADAQLIAATPDLLQALKQMLDAFHYDPLGGGQDAAVEAALDAVAKAEGEK